ncbi:type IX secretion system protein PorD [Mesonia maritima]|uniref:DUF4835 domain-containing protein n=1 Tax=Mesonia maritima TaxID=1793873 RepID=A0ABU1K3X7_9FLAO|nr:DUF4835 family protein [Mesonia maritima]MDR6300320.1 hypothetical protein [Mesonia maritima]
MKKFLLGVIFFVSVVRLASAQEINCQIQVAAQQTGNTQLSIFNTLQTSLQEFVNENNWTKLDLENHQRINCSIFINVTEYNSNNFKATIQVQSSRPIFGSTTSSPIFNFKDNQFNFTYTEFQRLNYNQNTFSSNLVSTISFYIYTILGLDADTFSPLGGQKYHEEARLIVNTAQQSSNQGWRASDGNSSRFKINSDLLSNNFSKYREALYTYHREGLDVFHSDLEEGKKKIVESIQMLREVNNQRPNSVLLRSFFDAKSNEIKSIFSGGPSVSIKEVVNNLNSMAPLYSKEWSKITY